MTEQGGLQLTVGQVAQRIGVPVRTVRFWSDEGLVDPVERSTSGYRSYDATAVARLDLVRTLRELGLSAVRELLERYQRRRSSRWGKVKHAYARDLVGPAGQNGSLAL